MKSTFFIFFSLLIFFTRSISQQTNPVKEKSSTSPDKIIFAYGGMLNKSFLHYMITLSNKSSPKICFVPTASGDNPASIDFWNSLCKQLKLKSYILKLFSISTNHQTFEEQLLQMDAIVVGSGNVINMLAVWKAQGIDSVLKKAYNRGIIVAGGSAGSLCWFRDSYTGSRPNSLSKMEGLGFINFSHCPHYHSDPKRKPYFQRGILNGDILPGYACDDQAGVLFINGNFNKAVSQNKANNSYFISVAEGKIKEDLLPATIIK